MPGGGRCQHDVQTVSGDVFKNSKILPETRLQEGKSLCHKNYVEYELSRVMLLVWWWRTDWSTPATGWDCPTSESSQLLSTVISGNPQHHPLHDVINSSLHYNMLIINNISRQQSLLHTLQVAKCKAVIFSSDLASGTNKKLWKILPMPAKTRRQDVFELCRLKQLCCVMYFIHRFVKTFQCYSLDCLSYKHLSLVCKQFVWLQY